MENTTPRRQRLGIAVRRLLRLAVVLGVPLWLGRRTAISVLGQLQSLAAANEAFATRLDLRLRCLEESAARAEAELRFLASRLGDHQVDRRRDSSERGHMATSEDPQAPAS